jgi:phage head maturation protease
MSDDRRSLNSLDDIEFAVGRIEELELWEVSLVTFPMLPSAVNKLLVTTLESSIAELKGQDDE